MSTPSCCSKKSLAAASSWRFFGSILDNLGPIASTAGGLGVMGAYDRQAQLVILASARQIGEEAFARSQFKPFTVTTGTGSSVGVGIPAPIFDHNGEKPVFSSIDTVGITREQARLTNDFANAWV